MHDRSGFSLFELAIVLAIIGLIAGSVLVSRDLIGATKVRAEVGRLTRYETALRAFRTKYDGVPGDFNQTDVLPGVPDNDLGNGDGVIDSITESVHVWEHLSSAGLIEGSYDGQFYGHTPAAGPVVGCAADTSCPRTSFDTNTVHWVSGMKSWLAYLSVPTLYGSPLVDADQYVGIMIIHADNIEGVLLTSSIEPQNEGFFITDGYAMGSPPGISSFCILCNWSGFSMPSYSAIGGTDGIEALTVDEAYGLDSKMDDGRASSGRVLTVNRGFLDGTGHTYCVNGPYNDGSGAVNYNMQDTDTDCFLSYMIH